MDPRPLSSPNHSSSTTVTLVFGTESYIVEETILRRGCPTLLNTVDGNEGPIQPPTIYLPHFNPYTIAAHLEFLHNGDYTLHPSPTSPHIAGTSTEATFHVEVHKVLSHLGVVGGPDLAISKSHDFVAAIDNTLAFLEVAGRLYESERDRDVVMCEVFLEMSVPCFSTILSHQGFQDFLAENEEFRTDVLAVMANVMGENVYEDEGSDADSGFDEES